MLSSLSLDSFYLTEEQLENSPSRQDGIDKDTEASLRMYGCELVQEAGILLGFSQVVMATGQVLLHRFYCKRSMKTFNVKKVAATALWVAAKLEEVKEVREHPRKLIEMVMVAVDRCIARRETPPGRKLNVLDSHSKEGDEFRRSLIRYETEMLKAFGFIMNVEHPHRLLINYAQIIFMAYVEQQAEDAEAFAFVQHFIQEAWNIANDSLRTTLCVRFKGSVVACGIIFYTSRRLKVPLPADWWELFMVQLEDICEVCRVLHELYLAPKPSFVPVCHQLLPSKPPTPAIGGAAGAAAGKGALTATPTPMLGATPDARPGGKRLDPSVRRTIPGSESTPNLAAAGAVAGAGAAAGTTAAAANGGAAPSPEGGAAAAAPGSARKRSRSRSPLPPLADEAARKRLQLDGKKPGLPPLGPGGGGHKEAAAGAGAPAAVAAAGQRPRSAGGDRADKESSLRDKPRSRSRDRRSSRSRSRDRRPGSSRDRSRRSRSRDRRRSRSRDRKRSRSRERRRSRSRSRDRRRSRSRDRRRERDSRDGRHKDRASDRDRSDAGRQLPSPAKPVDKQQQRQPDGVSLPPPPAQSPTQPSPSKQPHSSTNGVASSTAEAAAADDKQAPAAAEAAAAADGKQAPAAATVPKAKPKAVRKQAPAAADAAAAAVSSPATDGAAAPPPAAQQDATAD